MAGSGGITYDAPYKVNNALTLKAGEMVVTSGRFESSPTVHSLDLYTSGKFQALGQEHSVSFGLNGYSLKSDDPSFGRYYVAAPIAGWNGNSPRPDMKETGRNLVDEQQLGAFAVAKLQLLDPLKLIVGSRVSNWERKVTKNEQKQDGIFNPYAGLVFDITDHMSNHYDDAYNMGSGLVEVQSNAERQENLLIIGDSYAPAMIPLLANHYNHIYVVTPIRYLQVFNEDFTYDDFTAENNIQNVLFMYVIENYYASDEWGDRYKVFDIHRSEDK